MSDNSQFTQDEAHKMLGDVTEGFATLHGVGFDQPRPLLVEVSKKEILVLQVQGYERMTQGQIDHIAQPFKPFAKDVIVVSDRVSFTILKPTA